MIGWLGGDGGRSGSGSGGGAAAAASVLILVCWCWWCGWWWVAAAAAVVFGRRLEEGCAIYFATVPFLVWGGWVWGISTFISKGVGWGQIAHARARSFFVTLFTRHS